MARDLSGADLGNRVGLAADEVEKAVDDFRSLTTLTGTERKRLNEAMDDLLLGCERIKLAHQRLLERSSVPGPRGLH